MKPNRWVWARAVQYFDGRVVLEVRLADWTRGLTIVEEFGPFVDLDEILRILPGLSRDFQEQAPEDVLYELESRWSARRQTPQACASTTVNPDGASAASES